MGDPFTNLLREVGPPLPFLIAVLSRDWIKHNIISLPFM